LHGATALVKTTNLDQMQGSNYDFWSTLFISKPKINFMSNRAFIFLALLFVVITSTQCHENVHFEVEKQQLLQLHAAQQDAHLEENAAKFVEQFDEKMVMVNRGKISANGIEHAKTRIQEYFNAVEFKRWEDVSPPQIEFSKDGTMAYMVVDKSVVLTCENANKEIVEESTHFAWVSIFKKQANGQWKIVCNVSTNEPASERLLQQNDSTDMENPSLK
jgi:ketosteroid isomerase-like protein